MQKLALAVQAMQNKETEQALKHLNQALILEPNSATVLIIRSKIYYDLGRLSEAQADCSEILRLDPSHFTALNLRSAFHVMSGEPEKSLEDLKAAYQIKPDHPGLLQQIALLQFETEHFEEAAAANTKLLEARPEAPFFYMRGRCLAKLRQYDQAIADFNEVLRLDPNMLNAVDARAHAAADAARFGEAIKDYSQYLKLHPRDAATYYNRALSHRKNGNIRDAIADYTKAIDLDPNFEKAFFNRAIAYNKLGDYERAEADFRKAVDLAPCKPNASNGLAWLFATCPDARFRNGPAAVEWAQKAYALSEGKLKNVYDTMAAAYAALGEFSAAIEWQQRYQKLDLTPEEIAAGQKRLKLYLANQSYYEEPPA